VRSGGFRGWAHLIGFLRRRERGAIDWRDPEDYRASMKPIIPASLRREMSVEASLMSTAQGE